MPRQARLDAPGTPHHVIVKERGIRFLKTIIPSRKATKEYLG